VEDNVDIRTSRFHDCRIAHVTGDHFDAKPRYGRVFSAGQTADPIAPGDQLFDNVATEKAPAPVTSACTILQPFIAGASREAVNPFRIVMEQFPPLLDGALRDHRF
jgi:hypothetical protein